MPPYKINTFRYCSRKCRAIGMFKGKRLTADHRKKISDGEKKAYREGRKNATGEHNSMFGRKRPDVIGWHKNVEFVKKRLQACQRKPNKSEQKLISIMLAGNFPFKYVGNGERIIAGKCPDFLDEEGKHIIELFGEFWHSPDNKLVTSNSEDYYSPDKRAELFLQYGYSTLIIWEKELRNTENVVRRIAEFLDNNR